MSLVGKNKKTGASGKKIDRFPIILLGIMLVLGLAGAFGSFLLAKNLVQGWTMTGDIPGQPVFDKQGNLIATAKPGETQALPTLIAPSDVKPDPWDGKERINILLLGLDYRDWEAHETPRSDTMILFSMDPVSLTASMLSIPRDMWVEIPGFGHAKINTAYFLGEGNKLPGGGPGLAVDTVEAFLGVPIQYYAQIDFMAFVKFIDEIGGVDIHVREELTIDPLGSGNTIFLKEGVQTFNGEVTLAYARARYTEGGDFDRAARQQQVIMAIRDNVLNYYSLPKLISRAPAIYADLQSGIHTNLSLDEAIKLAWLVAQVDDRNIKRAVIGTDMINFGTSPDGLSIMKPLPDKIRVLRDELFTTGGPLGPQAVQNDQVALLQSEAARVSLQNGTTTGGLATRTREYLASQGVSVVEETNASFVYGASEIQIYNGKPYTAKYLAGLLGIDTGRVTFQYNPDLPVDIVLILGSDWEANNPIP